MKVFYTLVLCLCFVSTYSQNLHSRTTDGTYLFQKATFTTYNYHTEEAVDTRIITDPSTVNFGDIFYQNVFCEAFISNNQLVACMLPNTVFHCAVRNSIELELPPVGKMIDVTDEEINYLSQLSQLFPYTFTIEGNTITFKTTFSYGSSNYNFPLRGELIVILAK